MQRFGIIILAVIGAGAVLGFLIWTQFQAQPLIVSGFIEAEAVQVGSRIGGRVSEVLVDEGHEVTPSEVLFRIDPFDLRQRLAESEGRLAASQAEFQRLKRGYRKEEIEQARARTQRQTALIEKLVAGPRPAEIEIARAELKIAQANLKFAEVEHERVKRLREEKRAARIEIEEAIRQLNTSRAEVDIAAQKLALLEEGTRQEEIDEAKAQLAEAQQQLALLEEGYRNEDVASAEAQVAALNAEAAAIKIQLEELEVRSPCPCVVEAVDLDPGDLVSANAPALSLLDPTRLWVRAYIPEARLGQVALGQKVPVRVNGYPDRTFSAHVAFIAREAEFTPRNVQTPQERSKLVFRVKVVLDEGHQDLRAGMSADLHFNEARKP